MFMMIIDGDVVSYGKIAKDQIENGALCCLICHNIFPDCFFFLLLWPHAWHMYVPGVGVKSEWHLQATLDPLTHYTGLGIEPVPLQQPKRLQLES